MKKETDYLDFLIILSILIFGVFLGALLNIYAPNWVHGFKEFQTLLTGLFVIIAAWVAYHGTRQQIKSSTDNHNKLLELQALQFQHAIFQKNYGLAASFSGDLNGLIKRVKDLKYLESFVQQKEMLEKGQIEKVISLSIKNNYFTVFDNLSKEIGLLESPLPKEICEWYVWAKGFLDTINAALDGFYDDGDQIDLVNTLIDDISGLIVKGENIIKILDGVADKNFKIANELQTKINRIVSE